MPPFLRRLFPNGKHTHTIDYVAQANSGVSAIALFPQLFALLGGGSPDGLSPASFFLIALNSAVWLAYGIHRRIPPLMISATCNAAVSVGIFVLIYVRG